MELLSTVYQLYMQKLQVIHPEVCSMHCTLWPHEHARPLIDGQLVVLIPPLRQRICYVPCKQRMLE
jgi:hypothetical protein